MPDFGVHAKAKSKRRYLLAGPLVGIPLAALMIAVPQAAFAATAVPLGTAAAFGVLAGSGITNTGATTIDGDTGSSPTASETGFAACPGSADCVTQVGANHVAPDPNDAATVLAKAALTTAYNNAAGQTPTLIPTELAGQTLTPGVYTAASGTFGMTGTLVLDGQGDHGAVFIFQTASTLITAVTGNVSLTNGAQGCNVFWQVGSAATLGAGSDFTGTIAAHDNISLDSGVTVHGRLMAGEQASGAGAVTLIHDTIVAPSCNTTNPVVVVPPPVATATPTPGVTPTPGTSASASASAAAASASAAAASRSAAAAAAAARTTSARVLSAVGTNARTGLSVGAQVSRVPLGAVQSGDGSMSGRHNGPAGQLFIAGVAIGWVALAGSTGRLRRLRRRQH